VEKKITGCCVVPGVAKGAVLTTSQPISFWGGVDPASGLINDPRHELFNQSIAGKVLVFPFGKGSSTSSLIIENSFQKLQTGQHVTVNATERVVIIHN
jgi:predicted aconitase with swiveling domain